MRSAEKYYSPRDVEDGLGHDGGPATGEAPIPAPVEEEAIASHKDKEELPKMIRSPRVPTKEEREVHNTIHIPHTDWCEYCVRGRSRNKPHPKGRGW